MTGWTGLWQELKIWLEHKPVAFDEASSIRIRSERFVASWCLAAMACVVFSGAAVVTSSPRGLITAGITLLCLAINALMFWRYNKVNLAARFMVVWGLLALFAASFNDGQSKSETLWMIGLIPMMASYMLSRRCWLQATILAAGIITAVCAIEPFFPLDQQIREESVDLLVYRLVILVAYCAVALFATVTNHRQIKELRRRDRELEKAQSQSETAIQAKNRFLANMSHEIRTPMHGILGTTQLLLDCGLSPKQKEQALTVSECGESLLRILNNILDISKIEAGKFKISPRTFNVDEWVDELRQSWEPSFRKAGIELNLESQLEPNQDWIADKERISLVIGHLLHNSLRFTQQGRVTCTLALNSSDAGAKLLEVTVRDTGPGISRSDMERVFDVFERDVEADGLGAQGMGLGLTISRKILALMGAEIELANPGDASGACFHLKIPMGVAARTNTESHLLATVPVRSVRGLRVLVADDQALNLKIASAHLEQLGCEVVTVLDGLAAVQAANEQPFDVILMDINMPQLNGWQASRNIRQGSSQNRNTPILALTADDNISAQELRDRGDMADHLSKPFSRSSLKTALARHARQDAA